MQATGIVETLDVTEQVPPGFGPGGLEVERHTKLSTWWRCRMPHYEAQCFTAVRLALPLQRWSVRGLTRGENLQRNGGDLFENAIVVRD
jgi:hypothetical protein